MTYQQQVQDTIRKTKAANASWKLIGIAVGKSKDAVKRSIKEIDFSSICRHKKKSVKAR
jgi:hypothetical protein